MACIWKFHLRLLPVVTTFLPSLCGSFFPSLLSHSFYHLYTFPGWLNQFHSFNYKHMDDFPNIFSTQDFSPEFVIYPPGYILAIHRYLIRYMKTDLIILSPKSSFSSIRFMWMPSTHSVVQTQNLVSSFSLTYLTKHTHQVLLILILSNLSFLSNALPLLSSLLP